MSETTFTTNSLQYLKEFDHLRGNSEKINPHVFFIALSNLKVVTSEDMEIVKSKY